MDRLQPWYGTQQGEQWRHHCVTIGLWGCLARLSPALSHHLSVCLRSLCLQESGNPGFSLYKYDRSTGEVLDVEYWWADLAHANSPDGPGRPLWSRQSSAREDYGMEDLSPMSWQELAESFLSDASRLNAYMTNYYKGLPPRHYSPAIYGHAIACEALWGDPLAPLCPYHPHHLHTSPSPFTKPPRDRALQTLVGSMVHNTLHTLIEGLVDSLRPLVRSTAVA